MITNPQLPPRTDCVEIELDGERLYRNVQTGALLRPGEALAYTPTAADDLAALVIDHEYRLT